MSFKKILFVCTGNSCSSPMAEAIMQNLMVKTSLYWEIDSAALRTWNIGRRPHKKCLRTLREHGLRTDHFCRLLTVQDFNYFDLIIALNLHVHKELMVWAEVNHVLGKSSQVHMLGMYGENGKTIANIELSPTHKLKSFRSAYYRIKDCCKQLILSQQVSIVRYDLPSTDEEDEREYGLLKRSRSNETLVSMDNLEQFPKQYPSATSIVSTCSAVKCHQKKLCQKCGQKFLATL